MNYVMGWPTSYGEAEKAGGKALEGKIAIVTGANTGLGLETAAALSMCGGVVVMACRSAKSAEDAIGSNPVLLRNRDKIVILELDLGNFGSIKSFYASFIAKFPQGVDVLVLNAGLTQRGPPLLVLSKTAEATFGVNHIGHYYLTRFFLDNDTIRENGNIVVVSSESHKVDVDKTEQQLLKEISSAADIGKIFNNVATDGSISQLRYCYGYSKLANVLFANKIHRMLQAKGSNGTGENKTSAGNYRNIAINSLHPGSLVQTSIARTAFVKFLFALTSPFTMNASQGAATQTMLALRTGNSRESGTYYMPCCVLGHASASGRNQSFQDWLWEWSDRFIAENADKSVPANL